MKALRVYPLFFLVLALVLILPSQSPSVHGSTIPIYVRSVLKDCNPNTSCVSASFATNAGDTLMVHAVCWGSTGYTITDTLGTTFTQPVGTGFNNGEQIFTGTSSGGNDVVTMSACVATVLGQSFSVDVYRFVTGIGVTNKNSATGAVVSFADTLTMIIQPNSFIYEAWDIATGNSMPTLTGSSGQAIRDTFQFDVSGGSGAMGITMDRQYGNGGSTGSSASATGLTGPSSTFYHQTVELLATGGSVTQVSNCYGNCGTPAVTTTNTNSTKGINFNLTQTYFYENQITFPALLVNMSAQIACSYGTTQCPFAETLTLGVWATQTQCFGATPFTPTCPAQLVASSQVVSPTKGLFTFPVNFGVFTGQWIALGFSGSRSGLQINDTNTAVNIFNTSGFPASLSNTASQGQSKAEVYAWATGNTIIGGGIIPANNLCSQAVDFICTMNLAACGLTPSNCLVGALILGFMWAIVSIVFLEVALFKLKMTMGLPGGVYIMILTIWITAWVLAVGNIWFIIFEVLIVVFLFTSNIVGLASGTHRPGAASA